VLVRPQLAGGLDHDTDDEVGERVGLVDVGFELVEEVARIAPAQRFEQHVAPTRKEPVERRPGDPRLGGDVVDRDLRHPPPLAADLRRVEHAGFGSDCGSDARRHP
jgi:hypothetical protein